MTKDGFQYVIQRSLMDFMKSMGTLIKLFRIQSMTIVGVGPNLRGANEISKVSYWVAIDSYCHFLYP